MKIWLSMNVEIRENISGTMSGMEWTTSRLLWGIIKREERGKSSGFRKSSATIPGETTKRHEKGLKLRWNLFVSWLIKSRPFICLRASNFRFTLLIVALDFWKWRNRSINASRTGQWKFNENIVFDVNFANLQASVDWNELAFENLIKI